MAPKWGLVLFATGLLLACGSPPASYSQPGDREASEAYKAQIDGKIASWTPKKTPEPTTIGQVYAPAQRVSDIGAAVRLAQDVGTLMTLKSNLAGFRGAKVRNCEWGAMDFEEVDEFNRPPTPEPVDYGYRCTIETFHRSAERPDATLAYVRNVYLWKAGEAFYYSEIDHGPARYAKDEELPRLRSL